MLNLNNIYTQKQIDILKACQNTDWFMLINHGAKRSGKTQLDNDIFLQELMRVRGIANKLGIDTPQYILAGYSFSLGIIPICYRKSGCSKCSYRRVKESDWRTAYY